MLVPSRVVLTRALLGIVWLITVTASGVAQTLPPLNVPPQNPITAEKTVLGKILFWEEQLSSDNTMACGTCHLPSRGGGDSRTGRHPGPDGRWNTADDKLGSIGVRRTDASGRYRDDPLFGFDRQVTTRTPATPIGAQYFIELFWDGRATSFFLDPETGTYPITAYGALESQAVAPILSDVEMAHEGRTWDAVKSKLQVVEPLRIATNLPPDVQAALQVNPTYPALFQAAFGDPAISARRIAYAIATYERTLVPDQAPWDRYVGGDTSALTAAQQNGMRLFLERANCDRCHSPGLFSDQQFRNDGLRPVAEDRGRQDVTGDSRDRGKFKVPTLRNIGLRSPFFHNGQAPGLSEVVDFYARGGDFGDNQDGFVQPFTISAAEKRDLIDFLHNGLTDPRVANELPPFDRPTLYTERNPDGSNLYGAPHAGSGGVVPEVVAASPANRQNDDFKLAVAGGAGGAPAVLVFSDRAAPPGSTVLAAPLHVALPTPFAPVVVTLAGAGAGAGHATVPLPIPDDAQLRGITLFAQWFVVDAGSSGGLAATQGARIGIL